MSEGTTLRSVLIANRGEIACRVIEASHAMGLEAVAVHGLVDRDARHVALADRAVYLGPEGEGPSPYLQIEALLSAAAASGADAVHPGYGFLAESAPFARAVTDAGLCWLGPPAKAIEVMGSKVRSKEVAAAANVPTVPGSRPDEDSDAALCAAAQRIGYPLLIKASAGGGGRGMRRVNEESELADALHAARKEAESAFGDGSLLLERFVERARHIEVQILGDAHGRVVHLGERECSVQRRHQKVLEEAPSSRISPAQRAALGADAVRLAEALAYVGPGTVEFLYDEDSGTWWFMEMNTRIQVEHPVTELVTGVDLVQEQLRVCSGEPLGFAQEDVVLRGHAVEVRLYAEDPAADFLPSPGPVHRWLPPDVGGVRVDHGLLETDSIPIQYDPMVAKLVAWAPDRREALKRADRALAETTLLTTVDNRLFLRWLVRHHAVVAGETRTSFLREHSWPEPAAVSEAEALAAALVIDGGGTATRFRNNPNRPHVVPLSSGGEPCWVALQPRAGDSLGWAVLGSPDPLLWDVPECARNVRVVESDPHRIVLEIDGLRQSFAHARVGQELFIGGAALATRAFEVGSLVPEPQGEDIAPGGIVANGAAMVVEVHVSEGDEVSEDQPLVTLEAMKMLSVLRAEQDGVVAEVRVAAGEAVDAGALLVVVQAPEGEAE